MNVKLTPTLNVKPDKDMRVSMNNITDDEFYFITSPSNLKLWATLSLKERTIMFH